MNMIIIHSFTKLKDKTATNIHSCWAEPADGANRNL